MHYSTRTSFTTYQFGFTLLEMVLVLFLMGLLASATLFLSENVEDQAKYDETKRRIEIMRLAIIGDSTRKLNGSTEVSGFVADMGRLPGCMRELLEAHYCIDASGALEPWAIDADTGLGLGWRGPYVQVLPENDGKLRFRDGYRNADPNDEQNSGWNWLLSDTSDASNAILRVQSAGNNALFGDTDDYPLGAITSVQPIIYQKDHLVNANILTARILFINDSSSAIDAINETGMKLRLHYPVDADDTDYIESNTFSFYVDASNPIPAYGNRLSSQIPFNGTDLVPFGVRTIEVLCDSGDVFSGQTCNSTHNRFVSITLLPSSQTSEVNLIWDIQ